LSRKQKEIVVKALLQDGLAKKFLKIKEENGFRSDSETVRFCIAREYKRRIA